MKLKFSQTKDAACTQDLSSIKNNIDNGQYETVAQFDSDMNSFFSSIIREHGKLTTLGAAATHLKKVNFKLIVYVIFHRHTFRFKT